MPVVIVGKIECKYSTKDCYAVRGAYLPEELIPEVEALCAKADELIDQRSCSSIPPYREELIFQSLCSQSHENGCSSSEKTGWQRGGAGECSASQGHKSSCAVRLSRKQRHKK